MSTWSYPRRAVHDAIREGRFAEWVGQYDADDLDRPSAVGFSIVADAALTGDPRALDILLEAGARLDVFGATAWGRVDRVAAILDDDRAALFRERWVGTPMDWALYFGRLAVAELLLERGYDRAPRIVSYEDESIRWAVAHGADVDVGLPLHHQAKHGRPKGVATLLELGADPNLQDGDGNTPLHLLARTGAGEELAQLLLDAGARLDARNGEGRTPVELAAAAKRRSLHRLLEGSARGDGEGSDRAPRRSG